MTDVTHVVPGPGKRFHGINELMTKLYRSIEPSLPVMVLQNWGGFAQEGKDAHARLWGILESAGAFGAPNPNGWTTDQQLTIFSRFCHMHEGSGPDSWLVKWNPDLVVPMCGMIKPGPPMRIEEAQARGMGWSMECAKKIGLYEGERSPLTRVSWKGSRRAYMHVLDCEVCQAEGVRHCPVFPLLAKEEIESDVDPRLDELL